MKIRKLVFGVFGVLALFSFVACQWSAAGSGDGIKTDGETPPPNHK